MIIYQIIETGYYFQLENDTLDDIYRGGLNYYFYLRTGYLSHINNDSLFIHSLHEWKRRIKNNSIELKSIYEIRVL